MIKLPKKKNTDENISTDATKIVVIGANGAGKTRFGANIEATYKDNIHRVSAQKSLSMPKEVSPKSKERAETEFFYGHYFDGNISTAIINKDHQRWSNNPNTSLLNDYEKLMILLHTEEYEQSIAFRNSYVPRQNAIKVITNLDKIKEIWEYVLPHRKLTVKAGSIETYPTGAPNSSYNSMEMSDGERVIFYLIGQAVSVKDNSVIIIDEPEMHIHKSITNRLWDKIEHERLDCTFVYLTHDIDFSVSREDACNIWVKSFDGKCWDYEFLNSECDIPEQLYYEILGSRKPVLFIEGDSENSIDYKLLRLVYNDFTVKPLGSCEKVFDTTKSFNEQRDFHNIKSYGLIDRDRRTDEEVSHINYKDIWVASVSEIENFLLLEDVVKEVASYRMKDPIEVFSSVTTNVISFFTNQLEKQALEHTVYRVEKCFKSATDNSSVKNIDDLKLNMEKFWAGVKFDEIYMEVKTSFELLIKNKDYDGILKVLNNKGLIHSSKAAILCGLNTKNDEYLNCILGLLKKNESHGDAIRNAVLSRITKST